MTGLPIADKDGGAIVLPEQVAALVDATGFRSYEDEQEVPSSDKEEPETRGSSSAGPPLSLKQRTYAASFPSLVLEPQVLPSSPQVV